MPIDPGGNDPSSSVEAASAYFAALIESIGLPKALADAGERLKASKDAEAVGIGQRMIVASSAAKNDFNNIWTGITTVLSNISNVATSSRRRLEQFNFTTGAAFEQVVVTVTGQDWVVNEATTPVFTYTNAYAGTSDVLGNYFKMHVTNYVLGTGFDVTMTTGLGAGLPVPVAFTGWWYNIG